MKNLPLLGLVLVCLATAAIAQTPVVSAGGILSGASFRFPDAPGGGVAPGSIISIFGTNLASSTGAATAVPLPNSLNGTSVTIGGTPAALYFASAGQINAQVPWGTAAGSAAVVVTTAAGASAPVNVTVQTAAPGIFSQTSNGKGPGAIQNFVSSSSTPLNNPTTAIAPGGLLIIYATGLGAVNNPPANGAAGSGQTATNAVTVKVANSTLTPEFAGLSPGFVGLYQVNVRLPSTLPEGCNISISLVVAGQVSNTVTVASARNGNCTSLATESSPAPNSSVGALALTKTTITANFAGFPITQSSAGLTGTFVKYGPVAVSSVIYPPANGGCIVDFTKNEGTQGALPDFTGGVSSLLDAGALTYTPPGASAQPMTRDGSTGIYSVPNLSTVAAGAHTVRGAGGAQVGSFTATLNVAGAFNGRTTITGSNISQATGYTATWDACPDPNGLVLVGGFSLDTVKKIQGTFFCTAACADRTFTVTSDILRQLPLSSQGGAGAVLIFGGTPVRFTATGIDLGIFTYAELNIQGLLSLVP